MFVSLMIAICCKLIFCNFCSSSQDLALHKQILLYYKAQIESRLANLTEEQIREFYRRGTGGQGKK